MLKKYFKDKHQKRCKNKALKDCGLNNLLVTTNNGGNLRAHKNHFDSHVLCLCLKLLNKNFVLYINRYSLVEYLDYFIIKHNFIFNNAIYICESIILERKQSFISQCVLNRSTICVELVVYEKPRRALSALGLITPCVIYENEMLVASISRLRLQAGTIRDMFPGLTYGHLLQNKAIEDFTVNVDHIINLLENIYFLVDSYNKATDFSERRKAFAIFYKLCSGKPIFSLDRLRSLLVLFDNIFSFQVQSDDYLGDVRFCLDQYENLKHTPIYKKLYKFIMFSLSASLFERVGLTMDVLKFTKLSQEAIKRKYHMGPDFIHSMLDTITFICERGYQCVKTGSISPIFHSGSSYEKWVVEASDLKTKSTFLSNPEPHGIDKFTYLATLNDVLERGEAINKYAGTMGNFEKKIIRSLLNDLQMIKATELTRKAAQQERKAPFSVLLYGGSSVAKSTLTKVLYYHYGKLFNLSTAPEYKYTRNPADQFWVNFNSTQWCVQLDDIAFLEPNATTQGDPSLMEMLQVINNVPYVPLQADLADKGRTPLNSRFVIATTNVENLNAYAYFSCPLAVQRRLPFVIDVVPKPEYTKDVCMLDGTKVPALQDGDYPDYWLFTVKRVVPLDNSRVKQRAAFEVLHEFDNIYDFLKWFSVEALNFECLQEKTLDCDKAMQSVVLCANCHMPVLRCDCQAMVVQSGTGLSSYALRVLNARTNYINLNQTFVEDIDIVSKHYTFYEMCINYLFFLYLKLYYSCGFFHYILPILFGYMWMYDFMLTRTGEMRLWKCVFKCSGRRISRKIGESPYILTLAKATAGAFVLYKAGSSLFRYFNKKSIGSRIPQESLERVVVSEEIGSAPKPRENERVNVWYKDDYTTTSFDISEYTTSLNSLPETSLDTFLHRHCVYFISRFEDEEGYPAMRRVRGVCVSGHIYMTNNHALPEEGDFLLDIIMSKVEDGVTSNIRILVTQSELYRYPEKDLVFLNIKNIPPRRDISRLFCKETLRGNLRGKYIGRTDEGYDYVNNVENVVFSAQHHIPSMEKNMDIWFGIADKETLLGDCGSLFIASSAVGPIILGIHVLGGSDSKLVGMLRVTEADVQRGISNFGDLIIQSGKPLLSSPTVTRNIRSLDPKSPLRFTPHGSANVYGSFDGFRAKPKSKVTKTLIQDSMIERGYQVLHGAPTMKGWKPWHTALQDMVRPVVLLNMSILEKCRLSFTRDILKELTSEDLEMVHIYDNVTAINGAAGVAYVDKINRNTSAGNPWRKSKKFFIQPCEPIGDLLDPVVVDDEIMSRVDICIKTYERGERYMPNFCAHLKDEAVTFSKIESGKTRIFTGAPFDWCIVVRKYLLSTVRLIQNKRFLFESAPGTIAQSTEWQDIYNYLTQYGENTIVAGDYGKFDKRMPSTVILAAFDIIIDICRAAGYSHKELLVVKGIAEDTAFPVVDYNGDLVEFFGCNPSGHPLTVIVNGLANSLYMRYCYSVLSPDKNCEFFKRDVALMTYGDDNIMGVSERAPFFNHTAIQRELQIVDIEYTMANKAEQSVPYINIQDATFLKRSWVFDEDVGAYLCPLDHDSINKMLTVCVLSKTISQQEHAICVIETALREYFFYGKRTYDKRLHMFREVVKENSLEAYVKESTFLSHSELCKQFWDNSITPCDLDSLEVQSKTVRTCLCVNVIASMFVVTCFYLTSAYHGYISIARPRTYMYFIHDVVLLTWRVTLARIRVEISLIVRFFRLVYIFPLLILAMVRRRGHIT